MMCAGSIHLPYDERSPAKFTALLDESLKDDATPLRNKPLVVLCRRGNDSQRVVTLLEGLHGIPATDLHGGIVGLAGFDFTFPYL